MDWLGIHEEMHRMVLRKRWVRWSLRNYKFGVYMLDPPGLHQILSERLAKFRPTYEQRVNDEAEMEVL